MVKLSGALDSAHSREDTNILLAQIILHSDYSKCSRVKKAFQCTRTMGVSEPFLHRESTNSLIDMCNCVTLLDLTWYGQKVIDGKLECNWESEEKQTAIIIREQI